jgi:hypothetical protein
VKTPGFKKISNNMKKNKLSKLFTIVAAFATVISFESCKSCNSKKDDLKPKHLNILIIQDLSDRTSDVIIQPHDSLIIEKIATYFELFVKNKIGSKSSIYYFPLTNLPNATVPSPIDLCSKFSNDKLADLQKYVNNTDPNSNLKQDMFIFKKTIFNGIKYHRQKIDIPQEIQKYINNSLYIKSKTIPNIDGEFSNKIFFLTDGYTESSSHNNIGESLLSDLRHEINSKYPEFQLEQDKETKIKKHIQENTSYKLSPIQTIKDAEIELYFLETSSRDKTSQTDFDNDDLLSDNSLNKIIYDIWAEESGITIHWETIHQFQSNYNDQYFLKLKITD